MEIVQIIRQYKPAIGGLEDTVYNLCHHLAKMPDTKVRIITLDRAFTHPRKILPKEEIIDGIQVTRIPYFGSSRYPIAPSVLKELKNADLVHVHAVDFFFDFLSLFRFLHRKPLVGSTHGGFFHTSFATRLKKIFFNTVTRFSCKGYKTICASSENDANTFHHITSNIVTIENGANVSKWQDAGSKSPVRRLIFIGRWSANKDVPTLIKLAAELKEMNPDWQLIIAGLPADDTLEGLTELCRQLGVEGNVRIVVSPSEDNLKQLIGTTSYITSASLYEGFGISVVEGLSAGLYPVVTPLPTFRKLLDALGFGVVIDAANLALVAQKLEITHAQLQGNVDMLRVQCMELSKRYAWEGVAARFMDVYKSAVK